MVLVLSAVVPWALRNAKVFQGVDQKAGESRCSLAVALGPSFLSHLKQKQGKQSGTGAKGSRYYLLLQQGWYSFHGHVVIRVGF
jgi:hypothetical protein